MSHIGSEKFVLVALEYARFGSYIGRACLVQK